MNEKERANGEIERNRKREGKDDRGRKEEEEGRIKERMIEGGKKKRKDEKRKGDGTRWQYLAPVISTLILALLTSAIMFSSTNVFLFFFLTFKQEK